MKARALLGAATLMLIAACGGGNAQQEQATIAAAVQEVDSTGSRVDIKTTIRDTGGRIPKGRATELKLHAVGWVRAGGAVLRVTFGAPRGKKAPSFDILLTDSDAYAQRTGSTGSWHTEPIEYDNFIVAPARLPLLRELALLAPRETGGGLSKIDQGFARKYTVTPGPDQLFQLLADNAAGTRAQFLKTASGHLDYFIGTNGKLLRVELHTLSTNPEDGTVTQTDAVTVFSGGSVKPIQVPPDALPVPKGSGLFSSST